MAYLRSKYPTEYAHLRDIEISSRWERLSRYPTSPDGKPDRTMRPCPVT
jgi:hypothetical protein